MVIISCTCGNVPETWIILKKKTEMGDTVLKSIDGAYTIHKVQLEDAGVYECESKNKVGSELRSLTLDVKGWFFCFVFHKFLQLCKESMDGSDFLILDK